MTDFNAIPDLPESELTPEMHSDEVESLWRPILIAFCVYVIFTFFNDLINLNLQYAGALFFLGIMAIHAAPHLLKPPASIITLLLALAFFWPLAGWLSDISASPINVYGIKYFAFLFVFWVALVLNLPPLYRASERIWGLAVLLGVMLFTLASGLPSDRFGDWFFKNPNNFALVVMSILFFIDYERDSLRFKLGIHLFVAALILLSGTAGALLAYAAGLVVLLCQFRAGRLMCVVGVFVLATTIPLGLLFPSQHLDTSSRIGSIWNKISLAHEHFTDVASGHDMDFWEIGQAHGGGEMTSGLWRLWFWREILLTYQDSSLGSRLLGHGLGSSNILMGQLPHNDYLRLFFEVGALGFFLKLALWVFILIRSSPSVYGNATMLAVYAFTENIVDNFLVMSLFVLLMVSARKGISATSPCLVTR